MKEKFLLAGVGTVGFLILRGLAEYVITETHWPQYAKDAGLFLFQNPVAWAVFGGVGAFAGWNVPEAFADKRNIEGSLLDLPRGSERI